VRSTPTIATTAAIRKASSSRLCSAPTNALPLSYPVTSQPLMSLPRFLVVLFPLSIWFASWLAAHPRAQRPALLSSALLMAVFVAQFATWHWVA
jgi:hypothetical protein